MRWLARRTLHAVFVVWAVATLAFAVQRALPSDPARLVAGPQARPADVARIRTRLGLDRPLFAQYIHFVRHVVHAPRAGDAEDAHASCAALGPLHVDLGRSYQQDRPVLGVVLERLPRSLLLAAAAVLVQTAIGVAAGSIAARARGRWLDTATVTAALVASSAPTFLVGVALQWLFAHHLRLLPLDGFGRSVAEHAAALVLPALTLGLFGAAFTARLVRDEVAAALSEDYARTARAKGLSVRAVLARHALRNAALPIVTVMGTDFGALVGGAIVTEQLFRWPGIGALGVAAILDRDSPMVLGVVLATASTVALANLVVDGLYGVLDPRVRRR